ncbi:MAG: hypothetical protein ABFE02_10210 [Sulfuricella sp.]
MTGDGALPKSVYRRGKQLYYVVKDRESGKVVWLKIGPVWDAEKWRALVQRYNTSAHVARTLYRKSEAELPLHALRALLRNARKNANSRALPCTITIEDLLDLSRQAAGRCMFSGIEFEHGPADTMLTSRSRRKRLWAPSLDRIDSSKGYEPGNIRLVCMAVNAALQEFGDDVLIRIALALAKRHATLSNIQ